MRNGQTVGSWHTPIKRSHPGHGAGEAGHRRAALCPDQAQDQKLIPLLLKALCPRSGNLLPGSPSVAARCGSGQRRFEVESLWLAMLVAGPAPGERHLHEVFPEQVLATQSSSASAKESLAREVAAWALTTNSPSSKRSRRIALATAASPWSASARGRPRTRHPNRSPRRSRSPPPCNRPCGRRGSDSGP